MIALPILAAVAVACSGGTSKQEPPADSQTATLATSTREVVQPTATPHPRLELTSFDCSFGSVRNTSREAFLNLGALPVFVNSAGAATFFYREVGPYVGVTISDISKVDSLPLAEIEKSKAVPLEPKALQPDQEGSFQFSALGAPFGQTCSVMFVECINAECRVIPFSQR